jgi:hypothetical protein
MQTALRPAPQLACPSCGAPDGCVPARCGSFEAACWCREASFGAELLARVPAAQRGLACICAACAAAGSMARHDVAENAA